MFCSLVNKNNYPILINVHWKFIPIIQLIIIVKVCFQIWYLKQKYWNILTAAHLDNYLRIGNPIYNLNYNKLAEEIQWQISH